MITIIYNQLRSPLGTKMFVSGRVCIIYDIYHRECIMSLPFYQETTQPAFTGRLFCRCTKAKTPAIAMMIGLAVGGLHTVAGSTAATCNI